MSDSCQQPTSGFAQFDLAPSIMKGIHEKCVEFGADGDFVNYVQGANLAGSPDRRGEVRLPRLEDRREGPR